MRAPLHKTTKIVTFVYKEIISSLQEEISAVLATRVSFVRRSSERVKAEYVKLCKKIKQTYGSRKEREDISKSKEKVKSPGPVMRRPHAHSPPGNKTENSLSPLARIIMRDYSERKVEPFVPFEPAHLEAKYQRKKAKIKNHFTSIVARSSKLESYEKIEEETIRFSHPKKLESLSRYLNKRRPDSECMNIERLKINNNVNEHRNNLIRKFDSECVLKIVDDDQLNSKNSSPENLSQTIESVEPLQNSIIQTAIIQKSIIQRNVKDMKIPFEIYHYYSFLWKCSLSHGLIVEPPLDYEHRVKVYIGKGNNSALVRGLMKRRIWFAKTSRIESANFVWGQLKNVGYYQLQPKAEKNHCLRKSIIKPEEPVSPPSNTGVKEESPSYENTENEGILTRKQKEIFEKYLKTHINSEERTDERFRHRNSYFSKLSLRNPELPKLTHKITKLEEIRVQRIQNHLPNNTKIGNKKELLKLMTLYYEKCNKNVFDYLPLSFHVSDAGSNGYKNFVENYRKQKTNRNLWIVKPGEFSNRGTGITVCKNIHEINNLVPHSSSTKTIIIQKYIERPLLYNGRKFDIRHFIMITSFFGEIKGYWYREGYIRTSSTPFTLCQNSSNIHLTNDAIQKNLPEYGKYEKGNKLSYEEMGEYLKTKGINFEEKILKKMKEISTDVIRASSGCIDPERRNHNFEIFGLDFMLDEDENVWLIEVNSNPCLELSCPLLTKLIPRMLENVFEYIVFEFRLTIDVFFRPPIRYTPKSLHYYSNVEEENKFDLVYDSRLEGRTELFCSPEPPQQNSAKGRKEGGKGGQGARGEREEKEEEEEEEEEVFSDDGKWEEEEGEGSESGEEEEGEDG